MWIGNLKSLFILYSPSKDWNFFNRLLKVNRGTKPVRGDLYKVLNIPGIFNMLTSKYAIKKSILENILNDIKA